MLSALFQPTPLWGGRNMTRGMALALMMITAELAAGIGCVWTAQGRSIDAAYAALKGR